MSWLALGGGALLQLLAGVVRVRGWFHVIRHSSPEGPAVRYRDVAAAHLGGCGWNAVLPARAGDAVKVALVKRKMPETPIATVASTLVAPALVEAVFTVLLVAGLFASGVLSPSDLSSPFRTVAPAPLLALAACIAIVATWLLRRRVLRVLSQARSGLAVIGRPRFMVTRVASWQLLARGLRVLALALVLVAAGLPFGLAPALGLMALQGATPTVAPAATAVRIALLAGVFTSTGSGEVSPGKVAAVLIASYVVCAVVNLAASAAVTAWVLRTISPRRIVAYARASLGTVARESAATARPMALASRRPPA
ncbi:MAG TPA: hypothetical protein VEQ61_04335 [Thermoleophilaceae bacterium]|nr:hypothetical protein [Thermoleophilaceae bacterium]